ncbi:MAG: AI-2E family transporter [Deltaproteobacteria bacterium]|nr:AI-2E family transporter [Deltaproteobacteria bacterium]MCX7952064.1 AI-2E family transporter [Deltaproteobacteria bacterium]
MAVSSSSNFYPVMIKVLVWIGLFVILYILRGFFSLIFLTFVFAYVQSRLSQKLESFLGNRILSVVVVALVGLIIIGTLSAFLLPKARVEAITFAEKAPSYLKQLDQLLVSFLQKYPYLTQTLGDGYDEGSLTLKIIASFLGWELNGGSEESIKQSVSLIAEFGKVALNVVSVFFLSLLFSFLIVLDIPALREGIKSLENSKLKSVYHEAAPTIGKFSQVLGRALEAQLVIAIVNTILTGLGLWFLGLWREITFLLVIVFFCSFIPVAGVFISSTPICLIALQEGGFYLVFLTILLITIVHIIEAYILNPRIYGHHLRMNPVLVLIILTIGGKLFGIWGLILGVPVANYIFQYAIRDNAEEQQTKLC